MRRIEKASRRREDENPKSQRRRQASWSLKQPGFLAGYIIYGDFPIYLAFSPFPLEKDSAFCHPLPLVNVAYCSLVLPFITQGALWMPRRVTAIAPYSEKEIGLLFLHPLLV